MYTVAFGNFTLTLTTTEIAPKSFVNNSSLTLRYCVIARLLYAKINPAFFTILTNEPQCTYSTIADTLQARKKTCNGDSDHHFHIKKRFLQIQSASAAKLKKKKQKSDSLVRISRQRLQVPKRVRVNKLYTAECIGLFFLCVPRQVCNKYTTVFRFGFAG